MHFVSNPVLEDLKLPFEWQGTPVNEKGRFVNHEIPHKESLSAIFKWQTSQNPQKGEKKNDKWKLEVIFNDDFLTSENDCIVWLGHASYFIRIAGITLLIDPVFYNISLIHRQSPLPVSPDHFLGIDYILISHDHRDHCDEKSIKLLAKNNPDASWLTGLNMEKLLGDFTKSKKIQTAGWYQKYNTGNELEIFYVPSRHWSKRGLWDTNLRLWGGYVIRSARKTIYFAGDSGYGNHFERISKIFPEIDYCMIGIGAYKPEFFMAQSHTSPSDALKAFQETKGKMMFPMHYGTFDLADEPIGDPLKVLLDIAQKNQIANVTPLKAGDVFSI